jgi:glucosyl-dolichyl phosphate glucuronosyltransferase
MTTRKRGKMGNPSPASLRVSVIICTYNRSKSLAETLNSLARMPISAALAWELLVVDNNSPDDTAEVVRAFQKRETQIPLRYFFESVPGLSNARNRAIRESRGEILAFLDDDVVVSEHWLSEVSKAFERFDAACVGGRVLLEGSSPRPGWWDKFYDVAVGEFDRGSDVIVDTSTETLIGIGANIMFKRSAFEQCGWFRTDMGRKPNELQTGEETDMVQRLRAHRAQLVYYPDALVYHCVPRQRFSKAYLRQHFYHSGQWYFLKELANPSLGRRILGVPRWRYRLVLINLWTLLLFGLRRRETESFRQQVEVAFFLGYFTAAQRRDRAQAGGALRPALPLRSPAVTDTVVEDKASPGEASNTGT